MHAGIMVSKIRSMATVYCRFTCTRMTHDFLTVNQFLYIELRHQLSWPVTRPLPFLLSSSSFAGEQWHNINYSHLSHFNDSSTYRHTAARRLTLTAEDYGEGEGGAAIASWLGFRTDPFSCSRPLGRWRTSFCRLSLIPYHSSANTQRPGEIERFGRWTDRRHPRIGLDSDRLYTKKSYALFVLSLQLSLVKTDIRLYRITFICNR